MNKIQYLARYRADGLIKIPDTIKHLINQFPFSPPEPFQLISHGFIVPTDKETVYCDSIIAAADYRLSERIVPPQLVKAHVTERAEAMRSKGISVGAKITAQLTADVRQELALSVPPTAIDAKVVAVFPRDEIWLLCSSKSHADKISERLFRDLRAQDISLVKANHGWDRHGFNQLFLSNSDTWSFGSIYHIEATGGKGRVPIAYDTTPSFKDRMQTINAGSAVLGFIIHWNELLTASYNRNGELTKITIGEALKNQWYEAGDPASWDKVEGIAIQLWVDIICQLLAELDQLYSSIYNTQSINHNT